MRKVAYFLCLWLAFGVLAKAQTRPFQIQLIPEWNGQALLLNTPQTLGENHQIEIETLQFYLSKWEFLQDNKVVWRAENSFHLVDFAENKPFLLTFSMPENIRFDAVRFHLGIDAETNAAGVQGGDLDPTKGMYWTWQSGYINFKLEGKSNLCPARNNRFQFHLGGYQAPLNALQTLTFIAENSQRIVLGVEIGAFLLQLDLSKQYRVMSPSQDAVALSVKAAKVFRMISQ